MNQALSIDEVISDFEIAVSQTIPLKHLSGFSEVIAGLKRTLKDRGWRKGRLQCRLELKHRGGEYVCVVHRVELRGETSEIDSFPIDVMADDSVLERMFEGEWGPVSDNDVENLEEFYESVSLTSTEVVVEEDSEADEETQLLQVINDWREEKEHPEAQRFLGQALARLTQLLLQQDRTSEVLELTEEGLGLLRECEGVRLSLARALTIKADVFLREKRSIDEVESLLQEARELIRVLKPDVNTTEVIEWIDQLIQEVGSK